MTWPAALSRRTFAIWPTGQVRAVRRRPGCRLAEACRLARRNDSGLLENDKQGRFPLQPEVIWGMSV
jgi:hypothetical protein